MVWAHILSCLKDLPHHKITYKFAKPIIYFYKSPKYQTVKNVWKTKTAHIEEYLLDEKEKMLKLHDIL